MILNIQCLRAFAALVVVFMHSISTSASYGFEPIFLRFFWGWGAFGVDIFFVISGFVMVHSLLRRPQNAREFLISRLIRIVPLYWFLTSIVLALYLFVPEVFRNIVLSWEWVAFSYFFLSLISLGAHPVVTVGWTLEWEMLFYVIFSSGLLIRSISKTLLVVGLALWVLSILIQNYILLEFFGGMVLAVFNRKYSYSAVTGWTMLLAGLCMLCLSLSTELRSDLVFRELYWGVPSMFVVWGLTILPSVENKNVMVVLGASSYSIYLIQMLTIPAFFKLASTMQFSLLGDALVPICVLVTAIAGILLYYSVEKPLIQCLKRS